MPARTPLDPLTPSSTHPPTHAHLHTNIGTPVVSLEQPAGQYNHMSTPPLHATLRTLKLERVDLYNNGYLQCSTIARYVACLRLPSVVYICAC
jgi:hypothetical protein